MSLSKRPKEKVYLLYLVVWWRMIFAVNKGLEDNFMLVRIIGNIVGSAFVNLIFMLLVLML